MKSFLSNFRKQASPSTDVDKSINRYADITQAKGFSSKAPSSIQSSQSFWNDPSRVNMVHNNEIILENERILPPLSSSTLSTNQDLVVFSVMQEGPNGGIADSMLNEGELRLEDITEKQPLHNALTTNLNPNKNIRNNNNNNYKSKDNKNSNKEDVGGGVVLLKSRIISDDVPSRDYGGFQKPNSSTFSGLPLSTSNVRPSVSYSQMDTNTVNSPTSNRVLPTNIEKRPDGWFEGSPSNNILNMNIREAQLYVEEISNEAKENRNKSSEFFFSSRNAPEVKMNISMFEKGKLPKIKKSSETRASNVAGVSQTSDSVAYSVEAANNNPSTLDRSDYTPKDSNTNTPNEINRYISQQFKVGSPTFLKNEFNLKQVSDNETSKFPSIGINKQTISNNSDLNLDFSKVNHDRKILNNHRDTASNNILSQTTNSDHFNEVPEMFKDTLDNIENKNNLKQKQVKNNNTYNENQNQLDQNNKVRYDKSSKINNIENRSNISKEDSNEDRNNGLKVASSTMKPNKSSAISSKFPIFNQVNGRFEKKPMLEIPKNSFVQNKIFKNKLEKIIANPVAPGKRSKSMPSLSNEDSNGEKRKYKFLVEGIDIPAKANDDEVDLDIPGKTKKEIKGFAYIKGKQLADEVSKRANEVTARKPHEYVEQNAMERVVLSHSHLQDDALIKARKELHAHLKDIHTNNSEQEESHINYVTDQIKNENNIKQSNKNTTENKIQEYDENEALNETQKIGNLDYSLERKSKSEYDLFRMNLDEDWNRLLGQNHSIPHDTSRVFLKPHDQDYETLKKLKKERDIYLKKKILKKESIKQNNNLHKNLSDTSNTDSQIYRKTQNNSYSSNNKKNKIKSRSKSKERVLDNTQGDPLTHLHAADNHRSDENTGGVRAYNAWESKQVRPTQQLLNHRNNNISELYDRGKIRDEVDNNGRRYVDNNLNTDYFEDLQDNSLIRKSRESKAAYSSKYDNRNYSNNKKHFVDTKTNYKNTKHDKIIAGFITLPDSNLTKSLNDICSEISGKLIISQNQEQRPKKANTLGNTGVQISGPRIYYDPFYTQDKRFGSLPNFNRLETQEVINKPTKYINIANKSTKNKRVMYNEKNNTLKSNVTWQHLNTDPEIEGVARMGKLYKVQLKLNNTPISSRVGSSLSNKHHLTSNLLPSYHQSTNAFKSTNYVKNDITTHLPSHSDFSNHLIKNRSNLTNNMQPLNSLVTQNAMNSDVRNMAVVDDRFAIKSIKSTETVVRSQTPNRIEFDLELLQTSQPAQSSNNINYSTRQNDDTTITDQSRYTVQPQQEIADKQSRRSRQINAQRPEPPLLLVNNQYKDEDPFLSDIPNLVKGSVLIQNSLNQKQDQRLIQQNDGRQENNLFGGQYYQARENPMYTSDMDTIENKNTKQMYASPNTPSIAVDWEETEGFQRKLPINKQWYHDYAFGKSSKQEFSPKPSGPWKLRSSQTKGRSDVSNNAADWFESQHIRQSVDVKREEEELIGPLKGETRNHVQTALNIDAISEKVELSLLNGVITIEVKVRCERLVPIRGTEDMFKKSAVVVTRMIDIDMSVSVERQAMYEAAVALSTKQGMKRDGDQCLRLGTKDTFELYCKLMEMADAADGSQEGLLFGSVHIDKELEEERRLPDAPMSADNIFNDSNPTTPTSYYQKNLTRFL